MKKIIILSLALYLALNRLSAQSNTISYKKSLKKLGATEIKLLDVSLGNKVSRVVAWTFLTKKEQQHWNY